MFPNGPPAGTVSAVSAQPTVGRIVHYTSLGDRDGKYPSELHAALITKVHDAQAGDVSLHVFYATGQFDMPQVLHTVEPAGSDAARGKWAWPTIVRGREILGTKNAGLADDGHRRDDKTVPDKTFPLDLRQSVSVIHAYRLTRGVKETEVELLEKLDESDTAAARAAINRVYDAQMLEHFPEGSTGWARLNTARLTCLQLLSDMSAMTPTEAEKSDA